MHRTSQRATPTGEAVFQRRDLERALEEGLGGYPGSASPSPRPLTPMTPKGVLDDVWGSDEDDDFFVHTPAPSRPHSPSHLPPTSGSLSRVGSFAALAAAALPPLSHFRISRTTAICLLALLCIIFLEPLSRLIPALAPRMRETESAASSLQELKAVGWQDRGYISADDPRIVLSHGRVRVVDPQRPALDWSGVHVSFLAANTSFISVFLSRDTSILPPSMTPLGVRFAVHVDGIRTKILVVMERNEMLYPLQTDLDPTVVHVVSIVRITEPRAGVTHFHGVQLDATGHLLDPDRRILPPQRRIEFVGDSVTAGAGNTGKNPCGFLETLEAEDVEESFAVLAARSVRAEYHIEAWSGSGLVRNFKDKDTLQPLVAAMFQRTVGNDADDVWDFSSWPPHAVVLDLGFSDFHAHHLSSVRHQFTSHMTGFLHTLHTRYPGARVFVVCGPMEGVCDPLMCSTMEEVVRAQGKRGHTVHYVDMQGLLTTDEEDKGCADNPSVRVHHRMAQVLIQALQKEMQWMPEQE